MKIILGLGNPGARYDGTRHNVGWWAIDRLAYDWEIGPFSNEGAALVAEGVVTGVPVRLVKPLIYMNRSGAALATLDRERFDSSQDLLVVVDDAALDVGRVRFRARGSSGGHNGLESIEAVLGTVEYPRLRIGVGTCPPGLDLAAWVLTPLPSADEDIVIGLLPDVTRAVETWLVDGTETAMSRFNR